MSRDHFEDACPGCRPAMLDVATRRPLAEDSVEMQTVRRIWGETALEERQAWHRFTCQNSRSIGDVQCAKAFADRVEAALKALREN